ISGSVLESNGEPVFGATVLLQNTDNGTVTEADGSFELIVELRGEYVLEASYMGYTTVLRKLALEPGKSYTVNISMEEDNVKLDEVTVTGKSIVQQVRDKAYNVGVVDAQALHSTSLDL